jgi:oligopeptide/dipeptide ABC transporter ATP-binding protein
VTPLLEVRDLHKQYRSRGGKGQLRAVDGVDLKLTRGQTLGVVGESGCGKSTLARLMMRLVEPSSGEIFLEGENLLALKGRELRRRRRDIQMVFQDPFASLDPRMKIAAILSEPLEIHGVGDRHGRRERVRELLDLVGLDPSSAQKYPHEFSGGQRQRIGIARAIALEPKLIILDEPVSALDVSIQSQILNLLQDLKARLGLTYILISHDLRVVEHVSDVVAVMYLGRIVEMAEAAEIFARPAHPYTEALVSAIPEIHPAQRRKRIVLPGDPPSPESVPSGCRFHPRCPRMFGEPCRNVHPRPLGMVGRRVECHLRDPLYAQPLREAPDAFQAVIPSLVSEGRSG